MKSCRLFTVMIFPILLVMMNVASLPAPPEGGTTTAATPAPKAAADWQQDYLRVFYARFISDKLKSLLENLKTACQQDMTIMSHVKNNRKVYYDLIQGQLFTRYKIMEQKASSLRNVIPFQPGQNTDDMWANPDGTPLERLCHGYKKCDSNLGTPCLTAEEAGATLLELDNNMRTALSTGFPGYHSETLEDLVNEGLDFTRMLWSTCAACFPSQSIKFMIVL